MQSSTFFFDLLVLILIFVFSSTAAKLPQTSASGDDAVVGQTVPSTIVDLSKGTRTTLPMSSSNVDKAGDEGNQAMITRPARKFGVKALALKRAPM